MTRSAVTFTQDSDAIDALLVMAHHRRSAAWAAAAFNERNYPQV